MVEVMIAAGILGGLAVVMLQMTKDQASQTVRSKVVSDVAQFKSQLQALLLNPVHCNANFAGRVTGTVTPVAIYKCSTLTGGSCRTNPPVPTPPPLAAASTAYPVYITDWDSGLTKITDRIRVKEIKMIIGSVVDKNLSNVKVKVDLEVRPDISKNGLAPEVKTEIINIDVPVVMDHNLITGCPRSWNTTVVY